MVLETDYDHFKNVVARERPDDTGYLHALHRTWSTMMGFQDGLARESRPSFTRPEMGCAPPLLLH